MELDLLGSFLDKSRVTVDPAVVVGNGLLEGGAIDARRSADYVLDYGYDVLALLFKSAAESI